MRRLGRGGIDEWGGRTEDEEGNRRRGEEIRGREEYKIEYV
jgi:hypothetical protein